MITIYINFFITVNASIVIVCLMSYKCLMSANQISSIISLSCCDALKRKSGESFFSLCKFSPLVEIQIKLFTTAAAGSLRYGVDVYCMHITTRIYQFYCHGSLSRLLNYISRVLQRFSSIFEVALQNKINSKPGTCHIWTKKLCSITMRQQKCKHIYRFCLDD